MEMWWQDGEEETGRRCVSVLEAGVKLKEVRRKSVTSKKA